MIDKLYHLLKKDAAFKLIAVGEKQYLVLTKIAIREHKEVLTSVFQPYSSVVDIKLPIFFLLTNSDNIIRDEYKKKNFPILDLRNTFLRTNSSKKDFIDVVNKFIEKLKS